MSTDFLRNDASSKPPIVIEVTRFLTKDNKWGKRVKARPDLVGCMDSDHRVYSDGETHRYSYRSIAEGVTLEADTPATSVWVRVTDKVYRKTHPSAYGFFCRKHAGVQKRLVTQGKANDVTLIREGTAEELGAYRNRIAEVIERGEMLADKAEADAKAARRQRIAEGRIAAILRADTELSRVSLVKVEAVTDEYDATRIEVGVGYRTEDLSVPDAKRLIADLTKAVAEAVEKNHTALGA